jgi:hypothetical protein
MTMKALLSPAMEKVLRRKTTRAFEMLFLLALARYSLVQGPSEKKRLRLSS